MNKEEFERILKEANEIKNIQGLDGNFNFDSYMLGLYNGMENIISMFEKRQPDFIDGHDVKFLDDKEANLKQALNKIREHVEDNLNINQLIQHDLLQIIDKALGDNNGSMDKK